MTNNNFHSLLERYWQGETSLEEERLLRDFFSEDSVPEELAIYKPLFVWKNQQKAIRATFVRPAFPKKTLKPSYYSVMKIAASVLIVLMFGIGVYTHYRQEQLMEQLFSESASDAWDARKDTIDVMAKTLLQLSSEQIQEEDSLLLTSPKTSNPEEE